jgi:hypothetical protein
MITVSVGAIVLGHMIKNNMSLKEACDDLGEKMKKAVKSGNENSDEDPFGFKGCESDFGANIKF